MQPRSKNLTAATPLLKSNSATYARNQYRLGFAYANLKNTPAAKQGLHRGRFRGKSL